MACNKEMNDIQSETYQAEFKANFPEAFTKLAGKDSWRGDGTEKIAFTLKQDEYSSTGIYIIKNASGTTEAETPAFWQNSKTVAQITAVFPASVAQNDFDLDIRDQSTLDKFNQCDILKAVNNNASFGDNLILDFSHAMAKVRVILTPGTGIDLTKVSSVKINSNTYAYWDSDSESVNGYSYGQVNACMETKTASEAVYEAMVVPGEINPTEYITIVIGSSTYKYTAPSSPTKTLLPGNIYTYNITVVSL